MSRAHLGIPLSVLRRSTPTATALALAGILVLLVSACGLAELSPASPTGSASPSASGAPSATLESPSSAASGPTEQPSSGAPTTEPVSPGASGSFPVASTDACFGSLDTKGFFGSFAQAVPWPVYCAVLPTGWSVETGSYQLRDGGRLTISYRRRADGARIVLDEGALCLDGTGCAPTETADGTTGFGDREAEYVTASDGSLAAVVDRGQNPSWLLTGSGIPVDEFQAAAAALHVIDQ